MNVSLLLSAIFISFIQHTQIDGSEEDIIGSYIKSKEQILMHISVPINQYINISNDKMLIYYPNDERAFLIHYPEKNYISTTKVVPDTKPINNDLLETIGYRKINASINNDTLIFQYVPENEKKRYPIITLKSYNGDTKNITVVSNGIEYIVFKIDNYGEYKGERYLKEYSTSVYRYDELVEKNTYEFTEFRTPTKMDTLQVNFTVPENINIEEKGSTIDTPH